MSRDRAPTCKLHTKVKELAKSRKTSSINLICDSRNEVMTESFIGAINICKNFLRTKMINSGSHITTEVVNIAIVLPPNLIHREILKLLETELGFDLYTTFKNLMLPSARNIGSSV